MNPNHRALTWIATVGIGSALLGGCASLGTPLRNGSAGVQGAPVASIYAQLDQGVQAYQAALQAQQLDQSGAGNAILDALDRVSHAARLCADTPSCDMHRVSASYDQILQLRQNAGGDSRALAGTEAQSLAGESSPVLTIVPQTQRAVALLKDGGLSDLVANNDAVKAAIAEWLTQMRGQLISSYVNYQFLRAEMAPAYHKAGLPEALLFGIMAKESAGKVHAVSRAGAAGPLQFMPGTAVEYGLKVVNGFDQRFDPRLEALANAAFINQQLKAFNDNLELTLAAYNAGPGFISRLAARGGNDASFWSPQVYDGLSQETREYVPMVLAAAWLFLHPDRYNLKFPAIDGAPGQVTLTAPASLAELTICLGQAGGMQDGWFRTLRNLNPRLDPEAVQKAGTQVRIPKQMEHVFTTQCAADSRWMALANTLHAAIPPPVPMAAPQRALAATRYYRVRPGDTLVAIARRMGCGDPRAIARANDLAHAGALIRPGMDLRVPACGGGAFAATDPPALAADGYVVRPGDTLGAIAARYGCTDPAALARANGLGANDLIRPGMRLRLAACTRPGGGDLADTRTYRVQPGDTLSAIAQRLGCADATRIAQVNGLSAPYLIAAGMELRLPQCRRG